MTQNQFQLFNNLFNEAYNWYTGRFGMCVNRADVERLYNKVYDEMMVCNTIHTQESVISLYTLWNVLGQLTARATMEAINKERDAFLAPTAKDDMELYERMKNDPVGVRQDIIKALDILHG